MQSCVDSDGCDPTKSLKCQVYGDLDNLYSCVCNDSLFWNGSTCVPQNLFNVTCTSSIQCRSDLGLSCNLTQSQCVCNSSSFWNSTRLSCQSKPAFGSYCLNPTVPCDQNLGFYCISNMCGCNSTYFYDGSKCGNRFFDFCELLCFK